MIKRALFLDRDGVINLDLGYVHAVSEFHFMDSIFELVREANAASFLVVVITNQAGIARGFFSEENFQDLMSWMRAQFKINNSRIDAVYFCPHHPSEGLAHYRTECECRKPMPSLIFQAAKDLDLDLTESIFIGDKETDMQAALAAGIHKRFLLGTGESHTATRQFASIKEIMRDSDEIFS